jgi:hypothetical protein
VATQVEKTIEVDVPIHAAYDQWTQFEDFPQFMGGVDPVRQVGDALTHWVRRSPACDGNGTPSSWSRFPTPRWRGRRPPVPRTRARCTSDRNPRRSSFFGRQGPRRSREPAAPSLTYRADLPSLTYKTEFERGLSIWDY